MDTHQQPSGRPDEATRALTKRYADICRAEPAMFAAMVRETDRLVAAGVDPAEARERVLAAYDAARG